MQFLDATFFGNTVQQWLIGLLVAVVTLVAVRLFEKVVVRRLAVVATRTETHWDDLVAHMLEQTKLAFLIVVGVYAATLVLALPERVRAIITGVTVIGLVIQGGFWASGAITFALERYRERQIKEDPASVTTMNAVGFVSRLLLWSAVLLLALDNLGVNITTLVAGLGVGGIAVALAVQSVLGDLFASLSIVLDKPFVLGDFLIIDEHRGAVEHIGLKTTRIRSLFGEQLVFSNADLLNSRIRNYGRMFERRVVFTIGATYDTTRDRLVKIPSIIQEAIESQEKTRFDRSHFKEYGDFSLNFETVYYVLARDYNTYMDIHQAVNLRIHERFEEEGIEFAFPTQTLFVKREG